MTVSGAWLLAPFLLIRLGLMAVLRPEALARAARFAPMEGRERLAYWIYQIANAAILLSLFFLKADLSNKAVFWVGAGLYAVGSALLAASVAAFCAPAPDGMNRSGVYRFSRNPMYVAYFLIFLGCAAVTGSWPLLGLTLCFQISGHWIIKAEERWCVGKFGEKYLAYMKSVRRYL